MSSQKPLRKGLTRSQRIVVKVGSKSLSGDAWERLAEEALLLQSTLGPSGGRKSMRRRLVIVSSGAIALGMAKLQWKTRPKDMARLQAAAAAGQSVLMQRYEDAFGRRGLSVAQVLLTHADLADRHRTNNARNALSALLDVGAIPVINENDAVSVEEIRFGDNDQLASMVVPLCDADLLILLSDVEGLLDRDGKRVSVVTNIDKQARPLAGGSNSAVGTGGMVSKVEAAYRATLAGAHVVIASAKAPNVIAKILDGADIGTWFAAVPQKLSARKHWIAYTLRSKGALIVDDGAAAAITQHHRSILSPGIVGVRGNFVPGDSVSVTDTSGVELARGLSKLSTVDVARCANKMTDGKENEIVVHRDDLVIIPQQ